MANTTTDQDPIRARGEGDAIALLTAQHRAVEGLLDRLANEIPGSSGFRQTFEDLADAIAVHTTIEEQIFHPAAKSTAQSAETENMLESSVEEHLAVKRVLATMLDAESDDDVLAQLDDLGGLTEEHVIEEEHQLFPRVRAAMDEEELQDLGDQMRELIDELRREGAPRTHVGSETEAPAPL
jgi:hemerythrin-like domain-containing protein